LNGENSLKPIFDFAIDNSILFFRAPIL